MAREGGMLWGKLPEIIHPGPFYCAEDVGVQK